MVAIEHKVLYLAVDTNVESKTPVLQLTRVTRAGRESAEIRVAL